MELLSTVLLKDGEMNCIRCGSGSRPLAVFPGMSLLPASTFAPAVAGGFSLFYADYDIYVFDRKKRFGAGYSVEDMAEDSAEAMHALGIRGACVYGASQGGMIAMTLAASCPELVRKLVLASTTPHRSEASDAVFARWEALAEAGEVRALNHEVFSRIYSGSYIEKHRAALEWFEKRGTAEQAGRFGILTRACRNFDARGFLKDIAAPVLVLGAEADTVTGAAGTRELAGALGCESYVYEGYSHAVYDEAPDFFARVKTFFDRENA